MLVSQTAFFWTSNCKEFSKITSSYQNLKITSEHKKLDFQFYENFKLTKHVNYFNYINPHILLSDNSIPVET